jgi:nucleoside-diphosphate-sugar epimerase
MRIALTGAGGFTGRYLAEALRARGHQVAKIAADITNAQALREELRDAAPDAAVHLAAIAFVNSDDFEGFYQVNQVGTFNLLAALADLAPGAAVLLASSAQVYGPQASGLLDESAPLNPANHYGLSKAAMELGARFWEDKLRILVVRPFNYTGIGQEPRYLIPKIVDHFRRRAPSIELGNIDVKRDFGDVRSVVDAYCGLLEVDAKPALFNVSTQALHSVREIVAIAGNLTGHRIEVSINPAFVRADDVPVLGGDNSRLRAALPLWRAYPIEETLRWMLG